jgi:hypothetical protein
MNTVDPMLTVPLKGAVEWFSAYYMVVQRNGMKDGNIGVLLRLGI